MPSPVPIFPNGEDTPPKPPVRKGLDLKDPFWWAMGGIAAMVLACVFVILIAT